MEKCGVHRDVSFITYHEATEVPEPCECAFYFPASPITPQFSAILCWRFAAVDPMRANQFDAPIFQPFSQRIRITRKIVNQARGLLAWSARTVARHGNRFQCLLNQRRFVRASRLQEYSQRNTLAADHHHPLRTFSAFGLSDARPPFFAGAKLPSANVSSQPIRPRLSNSPRKIRQISSHTPASSQSRRRRQQVLGEGKSSGRSFQRAPLRRTQRMPSRHCRSSTGGRPPWRLSVRFGRWGRILSHCRSVSSLLVIATPFAYQGDDKGSFSFRMHQTRF